MERARGTQLSVVSWTTIGLCRVCDADELVRTIEHGGAVLPEEVPTVDPTTPPVDAAGSPGSGQVSASAARPVVSVAADGSYTGVVAGPGSG